MNIFQIECFLALSQSLNFTQTAEDMFISQPTLSRTIASLERDIGVQLLLRNTKTVELTAAGVRFAKSCSEMLELYNRSVEDAKRARVGVSGQLKLGIQQDAFEPFVVDLVNRFRQEHPEIELVIKPQSISRLQRKLHDGSLDLIIGSGESNLKHAGRLLLSERSECAVLPIWHSLAGEESISMEALKDEHFVAMSPLVSASGHYLVMKYANDAGFSPNIVATAESVPSLMMLVACGVGVTVLYRDLEINAHHRLKFIPLQGVERFKRFLIWNEESRNPALWPFVRCAEQQVQETAPVLSSP